MVPNIFLDNPLFGRMFIKVDFLDSSWLKSTMLSLKMIVNRIVLFVYSTNFPCQDSVTNVITNIFSLKKMVQWKPVIVHAKVINLIQESLLMSSPSCYITHKGNIFLWGQCGPYSFLSSEVPICGARLIPYMWHKAST